MSGVFFFKQKTAYEMRISDWSSDVCSSDLRHFAAQLEAPAQLLHDALLLRFSNGLRMELRFAGADEYALAWQWGEAQLRIDTAPVHPELTTFPQHLHDRQDRKSVV